MSDAGIGNEFTSERLRGIADKLKARSFDSASKEPAFYHDLHKLLTNQEALFRRVIDLDLCLFQIDFLSSHESHRNKPGEALDKISSIVKSIIPGVTTVLNAAYADLQNCALTVEKIGSAVQGARDAEKDTPETLKKYAEDMRGFGAFNLRDAEKQRDAEKDEVIRKLMGIVMVFRNADDSFKVWVGGNPIVVDRFIDECDVALTRAKEALGE